MAEIKSAARKRSSVLKYDQLLSGITAYAT